ncbi:hypothetical protein WMY93_012714 [Mugilogobius chulae]|uniref:Uncharacterized protein n=1 Tax=Mugilogobius chulae TaxID=88201 RepID=A0AAW0NZK3_9GOBI
MDANYGGGLLDMVKGGAGKFFSNFKDNLKDTLKDTSTKVMHQVATYTKGELDIAYITSRIIVMTYPAESVQIGYQNHVEDIRSFLDSRHADHYTVFNLSQRNYRGAKFSNRDTPVGSSHSTVGPSVTVTAEQQAQPLITTRTVATQLSLGTLREHYRSKGTQATVSTFSRGTVTEQPCLQLSSTPVKPSTSGYGERPQKRPRLDIEEEEQEESDENTSFSVPLPHDSSYEPGASITDMSDLTEMEDATEYQDAKYIVFESCLRELFENCPICKKHCQLQQRRCGTFVAYTQYCPHCSYSRKWQSQPIQGSTPVGNVQLSAAVYFSGASFVQLGKICKAMNLKVHQYVTFRRHARNFLEPAIYHKWKMDQSKVLEEVKTKGKIAVGGDMRADSPGHSAKFGSYTIMELESNKILDIQLVQSNEVGGSAYMEKEGLKRSLTLLESKSVQIDYIVTDRHTQVQKFLRDRGTTQYYDVWHLVKAASSKTGPEKVAKWTSLVNHVQDVHTHEDPLFPKCEHAVKVSRDPHKWFKPGTMALYKLEKMLLNKRILRDVAKLSSAYQTSSLESFHSVILRFTPKNVVFPYIGMMCRLCEGSDGVSFCRGTCESTPFVDELRKVPVP